MFKLSGTSRQSIVPARFPRGVSPSARVPGVLRLRRFRWADRHHGSATLEGKPGVGGTPGLDWDAGVGVNLHTRGQMVRNLRGGPGWGVER